ncbi:hypothetical protein J5X84_35835 [Streptosporangiaceae bacterium NEAU-GS5]|nr:hypothetical protein [Streptosporangiaceae bacterium NEAU-GS5]
MLNGEDPGKKDLDLLTRLCAELTELGHTAEIREISTLMPATALVLRTLPLGLPLFIFVSTDSEFYVWQQPTNRYPTTDIPHAARMFAALADPDSEQDEATGL